MTATDVSTRTRMAEWLGFFIDFINDIQLILNPPFTPVLKNITNIKVKITSEGYNNKIKLKINVNDFHNYKTIKNKFNSTYTRLLWNYVIRLYVTNI